MSTPHTLCIQRTNHAVNIFVYKRPSQRQATPVERPLDNVILNISVLIFIPDERPDLLKGHISGAKGVASQEGFH